MSGAAGILVGVDGSAESTLALDWAVEEAAGCHAGLTVVHVCEAGAYGLWRRPSSVRASMRQLTEPILADAVARVRQLDPTIALRSRLILGSVVPSLLRLAGQAKLVVVGRHGRGAFSEHLPGSVSLRLLAHSPCPAVMVLGGARTDRVLAGVDHRFAEGSAVDFAIAEASRRRAKLVLLHCLEIPDWPVGPLPPAGVVIERRARQQLLDDLVARIGRNHPQLRLAGEVTVGNPGLTLPELCTPEDLLVLGQHRHAPLLPARAGRVISAVVHHSRCPVAVVAEQHTASEPVASPQPAIGRRLAVGTD